MLCFVISKHDYERCINKLLKVDPKYVCIGSVNNAEQLENVCNAIPCITEIKYEKINKAECCFIVCNI